MVFNMLGYKGCYIKVAVVISLALLEYGLDVVVGGSCSKQFFWQQLFANKKVIS